VVADRRRVTLPGIGGHLARPHLQSRRGDLSRVAQARGPLPHARGPL